MSTFTPSLNLEQVARGGDVGTWDTPTNSNWAITDSVVGGIATIGLNNSNVVLSAGQFQSAGITFNSTLTGSVTITFPSTFTKNYRIRNTCTGSSQFTVTLGTTATGGQVICAPPGESIECINDGANLYFHNLDRVGSYMDWAGSSVPAWISGCTVPPYLNCDGTSFSSGTYPVLANYLGGTTLPDMRGRVRAYLNQTTARMNSSNSGVNGNTLGAGGGSEFMQQHQHTATFTGTSNQTTNSAALVATGGSATALQTGGGANIGQAALLFTATGTVAIGSSLTPNSSTTGATGQSSFAQNMQPTCVGGLTMIRAA